MSNRKHYNGMYYIEHIGHHTDSGNGPKGPPEMAMLMHNEGMDFVKIHPVPLKPKKAPTSKIEDLQPTKADEALILTQAKQIIELTEEIERYRDKVFDLEGYINRAQFKEVKEGPHTDSFYKKKLEEILSQPNCNGCAYSAHNSCGMCPPMGESVRINCPHYRPKEEAES